MRTIPVGGGHHAIVDDADFALVGHLRWHRLKRKDGGLYAVRSQTRRPDGSRPTVLLHREIMRPPAGMEVDHINGDTLDNRRCNLRICTHQQNQCNADRKNTMSGVKGVVRDGNRWRAIIQVCGRRINLGGFDQKEDALRAYNDAAITNHGSFARLNKDATNS